MLKNHSSIGVDSREFQGLTCFAITQAIILEEKLIFEEYHCRSDLLVVFKLVHECSKVYCIHNINQPRRLHIEKIQIALGTSLNINNMNEWVKSISDTLQNTADLKSTNGRHENHRIQVRSLFNPYIVVFYAACCTLNAMAYAGFRHTNVSC